MNESNSRTISTGEWLITILLISLPLLNIIMPIVWAASENTPPSKKTFAKAWLIWLGICVITAIGIALLAVALGVAAGAAGGLNQPGV